MRTLLKYVSWRHLVRRRGRTALTVTGIVLGVAMIMSVLALNGTITDAYTKLFSGLSGAAEMEITALSDAGIDEHSLNTALQTEGVAAAAPVVKGNTIVFPSGQGEGSHPAPAPTGNQASVFLLGIRPDEAEYAMRTYVLSDGRLLRPDDDGSVLLTESLAANLDVELGDDVQLLTNVGKRTFTVVGLIGAGGPSIVNAGQLVVLPLSDAQRVLGKTGRIDQIGLTLAAEADRGRVERSLQSAIDAGARIGPPTGGRAVDDVLGSLNLMLTFAGAISLFAAFFLMYNNVSMAMAERRREYGILISLGLPGRPLANSVLAEAALVSLIGGSIGVVLGVVIADVMLHALGDTLAGALRLGVGGVSANPLAAFVAVTAGVIASVGAAFIPARRATRISPTEVLRPIPPVKRLQRRRQFIGGGVLVVIGATVSGLLLLYGTPANFDVFIWPVFAAMLVAFVGVIIVLQAAVHRLPDVLRGPLSTLLGLPGRLAAGNLGRWPSRTATTVGALLVALSMLVGVTALSQSYETYLHRWMNEDTNWDLLVSSSWLGLGAETPIVEGFRADIEAIPGVAFASPERFVFLDYGDGRVYVSVFDMTEFARFGTFRVAEGPRPEDVMDALLRGAVAVSRPFAFVHEVHVGDTITLPTPTGNHAVTVAAIVDDMSLAGGTMYIDRDVYKGLWRDDAVDAFAVNVEAGADVETVRRDILQAFAGSELPLTVQTSAEFAAGLSDMVTESFSLIQALVAVALLVAALGIANTLVMTVLERRRELAELRALGASQSHIRRIVLGEAVGAGLLGSALGAVVGVVMTVAMVEANRRFIGIAYPLVLPPSLVLITAGIGLVLAPVAGWIPARIAARLPIVEGMRVE